MNRLEEIEVRMKEIGELLTGEKRDELKEEDIEKLEKEVADLKEKRSMIEEYMQDNQERRSRLDKLKEQVLADAAKGTQKPTPTPRVEQRTYSVDDVEYRNAWAKTLLCQPLTEIERRALADVNGIEYRELGFAVTTTSTEFSAPTAGADGVNNGGLFIPQYVSDRLLQNMDLGSPILQDIGKMNVPGMLKFPYEKSADPAKWREEGICNDLESIEWGELKLFVKELSKTIRVTWKLEALTPDSFITYIISELRRKMQRERARGVIYGDGNLEPDGLKGSSFKVTYSASDNLIDMAVTNSERISGENFTGAKLYLSRSASNKLALEKTSNGDYILPPINGNGISSIAQIPIEVDPYLEGGDALLGNITNGAILNTVEGLSITKDVSGRCRINDYTAYEVLGTVVFPGYTIFFELDSTPTP